MHTETEQAIKQFLLNKTLSDIEFYIINEKYFVFDEEHTWVIDAGVELSFGEERFSFGWNANKEVHQHHFGKITELHDGMESTDLDAPNVSGIKALTGNRIKDVKMQWNWYSELDENFEPLETKTYVPVEMILTFENESVLQLAAISYEIDRDHKKMKNVAFDSEGSFLVTLNAVIEIGNEMLEQYDEETV